MGLLFVLLPPAEVMLAVYLGRHYGWLLVIAGLLLGVVLGSQLIQHRGQRFFREAMAALNRQEMPTEALLGGIAWWVAGALLVFPGFISDALALLVLLPPVRWRVLARFQRVAEERMVNRQGGAAFQWTPRGGWQGQTGRADGGGDVFEGEGREIVEDAPQLAPRRDETP